MGLHNPKKDWWAKRGRKIPMMPRMEEIVARLKWWQRIYVAINLLFRRIWRNLFGRMKSVN